MAISRLVSTALLLLVVLGLTAETALATWFSPRVAAENASVEEGRHLTVDSQGRVHLVFQRASEYYHAVMEDYEWGEPRRISGAGDLEHPVVAADSQNRIHLVGVLRGGGTVSYLRWDDSEWISLPSPSTGAVNDLNFATIALDGADNAHVLWMGDIGGQDFVHHRIWNGASWGQTRIVSTGSTAEILSAAATDAKGFVHVVYAGERPSTSGRRLHWAMWDGFSWSEETELSFPAITWGQVPQLASDSQGLLHLAWKGDTSGPERIYYSYWDRFSWAAAEELPVLGANGTEASLCVDQDNTPHVAFRSNSGSFWEAVTCSRVSGQWSQLVAHGRTDQSPSIAWDSSLGGLHLTYRNQDIVFHRMKADLPPPILTSVWPNSEPREDMVGFVLDGDGMVYPDSVWFESSRFGAVSVPIELLDYSPTTSATYSVDLSGVEPDVYDLVYQNGDGQTGTLPQSYEVLPTLAWLPYEVVGSVGSPVRVTSSGETVHVLFQESIDVKHAARIGEEWGITSIGTTTNSHMDLVGDSTGVHIVYIGDSSNLQYRYWADGEYLISDSPGTTTSDFAIEVNGEGVPYLLRRSGAELVMQTRSDSVWSTEEIVSDAPSGSDVTFPGLAIRDQSIHVVWTDSRNNNEDIFYRLRVGGVWQPSERISTSQGDDRLPSIAIDLQDRPHVVWSEGQQFWHTFLDGDAWSPPAPVDASTALPGGRIATGADALGNVHFTWQDRRTNRSEVYYKRWNGVAWSQSTRLTEYPWDSSQADISVTAGGDCHVVWVNNSELRYSSRLRTKREGPTVTSIRPPIVENFGTVGLELRGSNWVSPIQASVVTGTEDRPGIVTMETSSTAQIHVDLTDLESGVWDIALRSADGQRDTLRTRLEVLQSPWTDELSLSELPDEKLLPQSNARPFVFDVGQSRVHLFWADFRDGAPEIYWQSRDGSGWGAEEAITASGTASLHPSAAANTDGVHVAWQEIRDGVSQIVSRRYSSGQWSDEVQVTNGSVPAFRPSLCRVTDDATLMVWQQNADSDWEIFYSAWDGAEWASPTRLTNLPGDSVYPTVSGDGNGGVYVAWLDNRNTNWEVLYQHFDGTEWSDLMSVRTHGSVCRNVTLATDSSNQAFLFWEDERHGEPEIYFARIDTVGGGGRLTDDPAASHHPSATIQDDGTVHVAWTDERTGAPVIFMKQFKDGEWSLDHRVASLDSESTHPFLPSDPWSKIEIVWMDRRDGSPRIYSRAREWEPTSDTPSLDPPRSFSVSTSPNPAATSVLFSMPFGQPATIEIFDVSGRMIRELRAESTRGSAEVTWDGRDERGRWVGSGVYHYRARSADESFEGRVVLVR